MLAVSAVAVHTAELAVLGFASAQVRNAVLEASAAASAQVYNTVLEASAVAAGIVYNAGIVYTAVVVDNLYTVVQVYTDNADNTAFDSEEHRRVLTDVSRRLIQPGCEAQQIIPRVMFAYMDKHRKYQVVQA